MPTRAEERLRDALRERLAHAVHYHGAAPDYAVITGLSPITAVRARTGETLVEDEDLLLGHTVKQYDADYGLEAATDDGDNSGDTLVIHAMPDGKFAVVDVLHDNDVTARYEP